MPPAKPINEGARMRQAIPQLKPVRVSLKWQVIAFMCLLVMVVASTLSWYFLSQSRSVLTVQFEAKARMLAETLAHNSETELFTHSFVSPKTPEDLETYLGGFINSTFSEPNALHVTITDRGPFVDGRIIDVSPKAEGPERRVFRELVRMEPIDPQANGPQLLYGLRYHIHINTPEEAITFHDQVGYWLWEPATGLIMQSIAIPRGQVVLAGGKASADGKTISVEARRGDTRFGICSTTFLEEAFRTDYYRIDIDFNDDGSWTYVTRTDLAIRGKTPAFDHRDTNTLRRVAVPKPNPLFEAVKESDGA